MDCPWMHTCARVTSSSLCIQAYRCPTHTRIDLFHVVCTNRSVSTPPSCARAWVCVCVPGRVWLCAYDGALHACEPRISVNILARVLYGCVKMSISRYVCSDSVAFSARRRSSRRRPSTRTSARGTPPPSRRCPTYAPLSARRAPRRTALGRSPTHARPVCAAVRARVHVRM